MRFRGGRVGRGLGVGLLYPNARVQKTFWLKTAPWPHTAMVRHINGGTKQVGTHRASGSGGGQFGVGATFKQQLQGIHKGSPMARRTTLNLAC